ncbi:MAG: hypothetical protein NDJ75_11295 [Thermoanaerobaculia bacterium]|nr:hypothetical protein [Thermoanaerobaculia bacterium]
MEQPASDRDAGGEAATLPHSERLLAVLDRFYDAAEHPERLRDALAALAELTGVGSVLLLAVEGVERRLLSATHAAARPGLGHVRLPLRSDALRTVPLAGGFELVLDRAELAPRALASLTLLAPHVTRALRLADRLAQPGDRRELRPSDLDRLPLGVVLLGKDGAVVTLNRAARGLLASSTALALDGRRLRAAAAVSHALLETLVERVVAPAEAGRKFVGGRLHLADEAWGAVDLLVTRCESCSERQEVHGAALLAAPGATPTFAGRLADLLGLAAEEAEVAVELIAGRTPADGDPAAAQQRIGALYKKLGTTRQADLLRFLLRPPGVVFEAAERSRAV